MAAGNEGSRGVRDFTWRDGGRTVVFRRDAFSDAPELLAGGAWEHFELLTTPRALGAHTANEVPTISPPNEPGVPVGNRLTRAPSTRQVRRQLPSQHRRRMQPSPPRKSPDTRVTRRKFAR